MGLCLRAGGTLQRPTSEELRERARPVAVGARLLSLCGLRAMGLEGGSLSPAVAPGAPGLPWARWSASKRAAIC